jgi:uncharacterized protein
VTSGAETPGLPKPTPDRDTQAFWDGTQNRDLLVQHCTDCGEWIWQPRPMCSNCHGEELVWEKVDGSGKVISWIVPHPPLLPAFAAISPFCTLLVEFDTGVRMTGMLSEDDGSLVKAEGEALAGLTVGSSVTLRWREQGGATIPCWTLSHNE